MSKINTGEDMKDKIVVIYEDDNKDPNDPDYRPREIIPKSQLKFEYKGEKFPCARCHHDINHHAASTNLAKRAAGKCNFGSKKKCRCKEYYPLEEAISER